MKTIRFIVNARDCTVELADNARLSLTYEDVVNIAGYNPERVLSVTYHRRKGDMIKSGMLHKGDKRALEVDDEFADGMIFNVADTSNA